MSVGKQGTPASQPIDVWRVGLGVSFETAEPVILIIDCDKQNIWPPPGLFRQWLLCRALLCRELVHIDGHKRETPPDENEDAKLVQAGLGHNSFHD